MEQLFQFRPKKESSETGPNTDSGQLAKVIELNGFKENIETKITERLSAKRFVIVNSLINPYYSIDNNTARVLAKRVNSYSDREVLKMLNTASDTEIRMNQGLFLELLSQASARGLTEQRTLGI